MESKRKQLIQTFCDLSKAFQERVLNNTTTDAELDAIAEKLLQCCIDVMPITVIPVESKIAQLYENLCDLSKAVQERVDNKTTTEAELDAISEKLLQSSIDFTVTPVKP